MAYRIIILGSSCAGKTTLGRRIEHQKDIPFIDLDNLRFLPGWQERPDQEFHTEITKAISGRDSWVIAGSYSSTWHLTMPLATHILFIDLPLSRLLWRLLNRTIRRVITREEVCGGNFENGSALYVLSSYTIRHHKTKRRKFDTLRDNPYNPATKFIRCQGRDVQNVMDRL